MADESAPLPAQKTRRRSIFDDHKNEDTKNENNGPRLNFPRAKTEAYYPIEYVEKVTTEIEQWKMHITKTLQENSKFQNEKKELENMVLDENILSSDRYANASCDYSEYLTRARNFCDRAAIIASKLQYNSEREQVHERYLATQKKVEEEIFKPSSN